MFSLKIEGPNVIRYDPPPERPDVQPLFVMQVENYCVSRWEPTPEDIENIKGGGCIELWVQGGQPVVGLKTMPHPDPIRLIPIPPNTTHAVAVRNIQAVTATFREVFSGWTILVCGQDYSSRKFERLIVTFEPQSSPESQWIIGVSTTCLLPGGQLERFI